MINILLILSVLFLVFMNAFFVAAEFGMVKLRNTRVAIIKKQHGFRGRILADIHQHLDAYLSACQLGITLASLALGWVGESAFAALLKPFFEFFQIQSVELTEIISFMIGFSFLSYLHIVVGELMPKSLAIRQSEKVSIWTAVPLYLFYWLMYPAIWLLNTCANFLLRLFGLDIIAHNESFYSAEEIKLILNTSHLHGEFTSEEVNILEHAMEFGDLKATEVMRSEEEMLAIDLDMPMEDTLHNIVQTRYSRYPVSQNGEITGIVHVKDLFAALYKNKSIENLTTIVRPILKVSNQTTALELLRKFREGMPHLALVYRDETLLGFVTLDNLLHILIGRIKDEFHRTEDDWLTNADGTLIVKGDCPIATLERALNKDIEMSEEEESETLMGLILNRLQKFPLEGEKVEFNEFDAIIKKIKGSRILEIKINPKENESSTEESKV